MTARAALREAIERLTAAQVPSASTTAEVLLLHVLGRDRAFLYAHPETQLTLEQERAYRHLISERANGRPTQYLTGQQEFWGLTFLVQPGVFIPRPETEHVVEVALDIVRNCLHPESRSFGTGRVRVVDVGTGTGCIALALASELPEAEIFATDIDPAALALAQENAARLGLTERVRFLQSDLLEVFLEAAPRQARGKGGNEAKEAEEANPSAALPSAVRLSLTVPSERRGTSLRASRVKEAEEPDARSSMPESRFDLIVSNPPYVSPAEAAELPREVRDFEPPAALFSPGAGLELTRKLISQAALLLASSTQRLPPLGTAQSRGFGTSGDPARREPPEVRQKPVAGGGGWLVLELGYNMASRVRSLLGDAWTNIAITPDLRGLPRVLAAQRQ